MRILIISLHFPPIAGMSARAIAELSRAMIAAGHEVHVLTVKPVADHPVYQCSDDESGLIPDGVQVHRIAMGPINRLLARLMTTPAAAAQTHRRPSAFRLHLSRFTNRAYQARRLWQPLALPDASADWLPYAVLEARRLLRSYEFQLVVSLGNPHTCHLAAFLATRGHRCCWVPFYGDAWGLDPGLTERPAWNRAVNRWLERRVLKGASRVAVCTDAMKAGLVEEYGIDAAKIASTLLAFPDLDSYEAVEPSPAPGFHLVYTGTIYEALQDPLPFLRAASRISADQLAVSFFGAIPQRYVRAARELGVNAQFPGWRRARQIIAHQKNATVLLVLGHRGGHVMPSKIYEYFAARRPVLSICGDAQDLVAPLIQAHCRGLAVPNREDEIGSALRRLIDLHRHARLDSSFDLRVLPQYTARTTASLLTNWIIGAAISEPHSTLALNPNANELTNMAPDHLRSHHPGEEAVPAR